jgi:DNA repair protein RadC
MIEYKSFAKQYMLTVKESDAAFRKCKLSCSSECYNYVKNFYSDDIEIYESCFLVLMSRGNNVIGWVKISQGGTIGTIADPILIAKFAIESLAKGVIIVHNHPSGNLNPSESDIKLALKVREGLSLFDIALLDALIITMDSYYSFADNGKI